MAEPYCLAMVLCDGVHRDPATSKFTILGTFDSFAATTYPARISLGIYFAITDGVGPCVLRVQLVDASVGTIDAKFDGDVPGRVFRMQAEQSFEDPLEVLEEAIQLDFLIPSSGIYFCELWADDNMLMQRRFIAREMRGEK